MIYYALVFIGSVITDCIPIFAPPAWMWMLFIMLKFDLNPYIVVTVGTAGTVCGRLIYVTFIVPWIGNKAIGKKKDTDLKFLGKKLSQKKLVVIFFVFIYAILPLSTTALFTAAGLAKLKRWLIIPPFFVGNLIGDALLLLSGKYAIEHFNDFYKDSFSLKNVLIMVFGLTFMLIFLFIDWYKLLEKKEIRFKWKFWQ